MMSQHPGSRGAMEFEIRKVRTVAQGRGQLVREREEHFRLMDRGLTGYEACRIVGINYRTGKRWRNGRSPSGRTKGARTNLNPPCTDRTPPALADAGQRRGAACLTESGPLRAVLPDGDSRPGETIAAHKS
ncbi:hypothetical protein [Streptomyces sp. NPDC050263]|uniref:hypothetical protein n=1 Tax=Streptomyces sp. NPDC050263 TaxID=3155037 RepID=UPI00341C7483